MLQSFKLFAPVVAALAIAGCNAGRLGVPVAIGQLVSETHPIPQWQAQNLAHRACPDGGPGEVQCELLILNKGVQAATRPWGAADIEAAYNLPSSTEGTGQIVAILVSYDNPKVAKDLAKYRAHFGLPTAKFFKYNQEGQQRHYPKGDPGWGIEIDNDVDMVSASCPNCTIYLVEANSNGISDTEKAEAEAVKLGAYILSNSFICYGSLNCGDPNYVNYFDTPGVTYVAAAGDDGYGVGAPMDFASVVSAGGTLLSRSGSSYSEVVWPDTGGGCVAGIAKPSWQHDPGCSGRTANDIAAVAWNVAIYDTYDAPGWFGVAGTSIATPIVAGAFALAGNATKQDGGKTFWTLTKKRLTKDLHVISGGTDSGCPYSSGSYLCTAGTGQYKTYSAPTGWGTPNGIGVF